MTLTGNFYEEFGGGPIIGEDVVGYKNRGPSLPISGIEADRFSTEQPIGQGPPGRVDIMRR
jgi:hypothetical protein